MALGNPSKNFGEYSSKALQLFYVPSETASSYTMYDDDGKTNLPIEKKQFELLRFNGKTSNNKIDISIASNGGKFPGRPEKRNFLIFIPGIAKKPAAVKLNGKALAFQEGIQVGLEVYGHDGEDLLMISVNFTNKPVRIEVVK